MFRGAAIEYHCTRTLKREHCDFLKIFLVSWLFEMHFLIFSKSVSGKRSLITNLKIRVTTNNCHHKKTKKKMLTLFIVILIFKKCLFCNLILWST